MHLCASVRRQGVAKKLTPFSMRLLCSSAPEKQRRALMWRYVCKSMVGEGHFTKACHVTWRSLQLSCRLSGSSFWPVGLGWSGDFLCRLCLFCACLAEPCSSLCSRSATHAGSRGAIRGESPCFPAFSGFSRWSWGPPKRTKKGEKSRKRAEKADSRKGSQTPLKPPLATPPLAEADLQEEFLQSEKQGRSYRPPIDDRRLIRKFSIECLAPSKLSLNWPASSDNQKDIVPILSIRTSFVDTFLQTPFPRLLCIERGEKTPTPKISALLRKRPVLLRANFVLTKDRKRPYYRHFCGKMHREGSCSRAAGGP